MNLNAKLQKGHETQGGTRLKEKYVPNVMKRLGGKMNTKTMGQNMKMEKGHILRTAQCALSKS